MREILFRAKTVGDNPKWVEGYYAFDWTHWIECKSIEHSECLWEKIKPETLCEFTGIYDKNGVRVFEGDILKIYIASDVLSTYYYPEVPYPCNVVVKWSFCAWTWETITRGKRYILFPDAWCHSSCTYEVLGNIYDNPELLEEV